MANTCPGVGEAFGGKPGGADADRRAVGEPHRFDPDQGRAGLQSELPRQFARGGFLGRIDQLAARLAAAGADDFGKSRPRAQGIGEALRLDIGAAAALGAHQAAFGERGERPANGVAVDPIGLGDLHLARQLFAGDKAAVGDAALDAVGDLPPQRDAGGGVLHAHVAISAIGEKSPHCHEIVMAFRYQVV